MKIILGLFLCLGLVVGCRPKEGSNSAPDISDIGKPQAAPSATPFKPRIEEKEITLQTKDSGTINAKVSYSPDAEFTRYALTLETPITKTDENLRFISTQLVEKFYRTERNSVQLKDASKDQSEPNAACWKIQEPPGNFCIAPSSADGNKFSEAVFYDE